MIPTNLFLDLYLVKFLNISANLFFPCVFKKRRSDTFFLWCHFFKAWNEIFYT